METITDTTVGRLANAVAVVADIDPPPTAHVTIDHDGDISLHPMTIEDRRELFMRPSFAGAVWEINNNGATHWSYTTVGGHEVTVFAGRR